MTTSDICDEPLMWSDAETPFDFSRTLLSLGCSD